MSRIENIKTTTRTIAKTSKRVLKKNLEKIQGRVFDVRTFVIMLLSSVTALMLVGSVILMMGDNSITLITIQHGDITQKNITKHRTQKGIEYRVSYPQFSAEGKKFSALNEIIRDGVDVFVREHAWDARKDFLYQGTDRVQNPYSINIGFKEGLINDDVISIFIRMSAHLPGDKRIEDAQTYTYDVKQQKLIDLADLVGEKQEFYDEMRTTLIDAVTIVYKERYDEFEQAQKDAEFKQKQDLFFTKNALKNLNFIIIPNGFVFYVPEEIIKTGALGFLEIPYVIKK